MALLNILTFEELLNKKVSRIFFYRICGTGMGTAASLLHEKGYVVEGGDYQFAPPMSDYLRSIGLPCHNLSEIDISYLQSFDLIVVGNVVAKGSEDAKKVEESGIPLVSFPTALGALILNKQRVVGIAGTHGKTTTTYFFTQVFEKLGKLPGYLVGGVLQGRNSSRLGDGSYFFIEADEYDCAYFEKISKFRRYQLNHIILTSLEYDHADIFESIEDIMEQFRFVMREIEGFSIFNADYDAAGELYNEFKESNVIYRYGEKISTGPKITEENSSGSTFELQLSGKSHVFQTNLIGRYNLLNLSAVILFAVNEGFAIREIKKAITNIEMVKKRQEERGYYKKTLVIDDFAHHPRAVSLTIECIKTKYPGKKVVTVIGFDSATSRSNIFESEYVAAIGKAEKSILIKPQRPTSVKSSSDLNCEILVKGIEESGSSTCLVTDLKELRAAIDQSVDENNVILILSNGTCLGLWESDFVDELR